MSELSSRIRKLFSEGDEIRDAGLKASEEVVCYTDIAYGDNKWQRLDVYRPKKRMKEKLPVIVSFHGGAWMYGDKERYQYYCMSLAERGYAVVNYTYRLAPEYKFPAPLVDANLVFCWVLENADTYELNTDCIFAVGDSAGAHGISLYNCIVTNENYARSFGYYASEKFYTRFSARYAEKEMAECNWKGLDRKELLDAINSSDYISIDEMGFHVPEGLRIQALGLNSGKYLVGEDDMSNQDMNVMKEYLPEGGTTEEMHRINVVEHVVESFPPSFILTAPQDFLKQEAPIMAKTLESKNVNFVLRLFVNSEEDLGHVFQCNMKSKSAKLANDEECAFFKEYI